MRLADKDIVCRENYKPIPLMNINTDFVNWISEIHKKDNIDTLWSSGADSRNANTFSTLKTVHCNLLHKEIKIRNHMTTSVDTRKSTGWNSKSDHDLSIYLFSEK